MVKELTEQSVEKSTRGGFGEIYIRLRDKENRIYTDEEVRRLPEIEKGHQYAVEWKIRKDSSRRLIHHLQKKKQCLKILEVGCGNGWLSARLSEIDKAAVTGIDLNVPELEQAQRVFTDKTNLEFHPCSLDDIEAVEEFDVIVFAASVQYFSSLAEVIGKSKARLKPGGEIHILDTKFYSATEVVHARRRSADYFKSLGSEEMNQFYFHHEISALLPFDHTIRFNPNNFGNRVLKKNPFYWICLFKK